MELKKVGLLLAKIESTYGTDPTPSSGANVIAVTRNEIEVSPIGEAIDRDMLDAGFGRVIGITSMPRFNLKFRTELRGNRTTGATDTDVSSGASAQAVEIDCLLRACNLQPTYTAESSDGARDGYAVYQPTIPSDVGDSVTFWVYTQAKLYKIVGAKGNIANIGLTADKLPFIDWEFQGMLGSISDSSIPASPTFLDCKPPKFSLPALPGAAPNWSGQSVTASSSSGLLFTLNSHGLFNGDRVKFGGSVVPTGITAGTWYYVVNRTANTFKVAATLGGSAIAYTDAGTSVTVTSAPIILFDEWTGPVFSAINFKLGNTVAMRDDGNSLNGIKGFLITDRDSQADFNPESVAEATHPLWADWQSAAAKPLRVNVGNQSGNRICIEAKTRIVSMTYADANGRRIQNVSLALRNETLGETPGSEFKLLFQ